MSVVWETLLECRYGTFLPLSLSFFSLYFQSVFVDEADEETHEKLCVLFILIPRSHALMHHKKMAVIAPKPPKPIIAQPTSLLHFYSLAVSTLEHTIYNTQDIRIHSFVLL